MTALAWSEMNLYQIPDGSHIWGREFQILPSGTMARPAVLHCLVGVDAMPLSSGRAEVRTGAPVKLYGTRGTETCVLEPYQLDLCNAFSEMMAPR